MFKAKRRTVVTVTAVAAVLLGGALAATLLTSGKNNANASGNTVQYQAGQRPLVPNLTGKSLTGTSISLSSYRGKVVVLNFWGSWCSPCRDEASLFAGLSQQYAPKGVVFLGDDVGDTPANALAFTSSQGITYPSFNDPGYAVVAQISQVVPVHDTPTTVVIDKTGHVVGTIIGAANYSELTTLLREAAVTQ
ncbi:MAG TPA: TlpA disulfide reductase family protein [Trebonia sp.]|nr:TlpA disulfide reductase family protein [Trebonia sp.]